MRYRIGDDGLAGQAVSSSTDVVVATVWFTLVVGIVFIAIGVRGRQRWLQFWGALTCMCCAAYFMRDWLGLEKLL